MEFLLIIAGFPMKEQKKNLLDFHNQYRGNEKQVVDICVIRIGRDGLI